MAFNNILSHVTYDIPVSVPPSTKTRVTELTTILPIIGGTAERWSESGWHNCPL